MSDTRDQRIPGIAVILVMVSLVALAAWAIVANASGGPSYAVLGGNPPTATAPEDMAEVLTRRPDSGRVDDRHQLLEPINQEPAEQGLVPILKVGELDILAERMLGVLQRFDLAGQLLIDADQPGWEQAFEAKLGPFARRKRRALVDQRIAQHIAAALNYLRSDGVVWVPDET